LPKLPISIKNIVATWTALSRRTDTGSRPLGSISINSRRHGSAGP